MGTDTHFRSPNIQPLVYSLNELGQADLGLTFNWYLRLWAKAGLISISVHGA
jgi:hypothetical protein